jgi:maltooligosyltrehalose synthase
MMNGEGWPLGEEAWESADLRLPDTLAGHPFHNVLTGESIHAAEHSGRATLCIAKILQSCPVGLLTLIP